VDRENDQVFGRSWKLLIHSLKGTEKTSLTGYTTHISRISFTFCNFQFIGSYIFSCISSIASSPNCLFHFSYLQQALHKTLTTLKADSCIACRVHAVPLPCRAAKGLECVFPIWFTQCGRVWFTLAMPCPCHALTMPFFSRPRHSTAVERRPVGNLPAFGFFRLPRGVPRRLFSEAYQSSSQWSIPTTVKSGSSTLQKRWAVSLLD